MILDDIAYIISGTKAEYQSGAEPAKHTPYLALMGELWLVFREYFGETWLRYNGTTMYVAMANLPCG